MKQSQPFGGERGEDAEGNKKVKGKKKAVQAAAAGTAVSAAAKWPVTGRRDSTMRDTNHDGKLSLEEFLATASDKKTARARFEQADTDKDGFLSREEFNNMKAKAGNQR